MCDVAVSSTAFVCRHILCKENLSDYETYQISLCI